MKRGISQASSQAAKRTKVQEPEFSKLDQCDAVHARRIQQRRRMIAFGKNTAGYDEYMKQVPKHKRRPRTMKHPNTPDHTLDIPTKRWQGLVRAWRKALHQYDPPDLVKAFAAEETKKPQLAIANKEGSSIQERQLAEASTNGMLVDVSCPPLDSTAETGVPPTEVSPSTVATDDSNNKDVGSDDNLLMELDKWEERQQKNEDDDDFLLDYDDSDDDLL